MGLSITDLKKGTVFKLDNIPYQVVDYSQKVMGRGGSIVNVQIKSLIDGRVLSKTFKGNEQLDSADVSNRTVQYLYRDESRAYFMDSESYEQITLPLNIVEDELKFLKEGDQIVAQSFEGQIINIKLPKNVLIKVTYTENVVKGDTTSNVLKDATLETGITVKVPAFIKQNDVIKVDTRTGAYLERAKS